MYVALKRLRFGEAHLAPGDEVPVEENRNYNLLLRQGLIVDLDAQVRTEADAAEQAKGYKARIKQLEGLLEDAQKEIVKARGDAGKGDSGEGATEEPNLKKMNRGDLDAYAKEAGVEDPEKLGSKAEVIEAIEAAGK